MAPEGRKQWPDVAIAHLAECDSNGHFDHCYTLQDTTVLAGRDDNIHISSLGMIMAIIFPLGMKFNISSFAAESRFGALEV